MGKGTRFTRRQLVIYGVAAVGLAAVIFGIAAISAPKSSPTTAPSTQLATAVRSAELAQDASQALSKNETATALALAKQALKLDPANADAKRVIDEASAPAEAASGGSGTKSGGTSAGSTSTAAPAPKPADSTAFLKPVDDLATLLPVSVSGWTAGSVVVQGGDALVTFEPKKGTPTSTQVVRALVSVHDRETADQAKVFITKVDKRVYAEDGATVVVGVVPDAAFGTDGAKVAATAFARGRFAVEVLVTAQPGVDPATLKATAVQIAALSAAAK